MTGARPGWGTSACCLPLFSRLRTSCRRISALCRSSWRCRCSPPFARSRERSRRRSRRGRASSAPRRRVDRARGASVRVDRVRSRAHVVPTGCSRMRRRDLEATSDFLFEFFTAPHASGAHRANRLGGGHPEIAFFAPHANDPEAEDCGPQRRSRGRSAQDQTAMCSLDVRHDGDVHPRGGSRPRRLPRGFSRAPRNAPRFQDTFRIKSRLQVAKTKRNQRRGRDSKARKLLISRRFAASRVRIALRELT